MIDYPLSQPDHSTLVLKEAFFKLWVPLSEEKTLGPLHKLDFLGITLVSVNMQASLPMDKLNRIREFIQDFLLTPSATKRDLLSLLGHLNFAMRIIPNLLEISKSVSHLHELVYLDEGCRSDLQFWAKLCKFWNGISPDLRFFTDAAPSIGFGDIFQDQWFADSWPNEIINLPSHLLPY